MTETIYIFIYKEETEACQTAILLGSWSTCSQTHLENSQWPQKHCDSFVLGPCVHWTHVFIGPQWRGVIMLRVSVRLFIDDISTHPDRLRVSSGWFSSNLWKAWIEQEDGVSGTSPSCLQLGFSCFLKQIATFIFLNFLLADYRSGMAGNSDLHFNLYHVWVNSLA